MNFLKRISAFALAAFLTSTAPAIAETLKVTSDDGTVLATFDQDSIEALGLEEIETETPWTDGVVMFEGVPLKKVLNTAGVNNESVTGFASDDYAMRLPANVIADFNPIIATRMNGVSMSLESKGPFWIMFDFDRIPSDVSVEMRSYAVWHLVELEVE